eukprot:TRINITY_DN13298_c0_g1_i1.p1 TRINITY_DN13298_c0_g1~~TRINITY_DN13298_c0_g1_i1.p1  ORF type:complete len:114 (+),score=8.72 TRINITY_DN13298_c0_g1_i1:86-427(+)
MINPIASSKSFKFALPVRLSCSSLPLGGLVLGYRDMWNSLGLFLSDYIYVIIYGLLWSPDIPHYMADLAEEGLKKTIINYKRTVMKVGHISSSGELVSRSHYPSKVSQEIGQS